MNRVLIKRKKDQLLYFIANISFDLSFKNFQKNLGLKCRFLLALEYLS